MSELIFGLNRYLIVKKRLSNTIFVQKNIGSKKLLVQKFLGQKKIDKKCAPNSFLVKQILEENLGSKKFFKKILCPKNIMYKKIVL